MSKRVILTLLQFERPYQEIADDACLSLPMVKKHLHAVFRKLEVTSRSQPNKKPR